MKHFSLIEVLVVVVLLGLAATLFGIKGISVIRRHRFESSVDQMVTSLNTAQHLMAFHRQDVTCQLMQEGERVFLELVSEEQLPAGFAKLAGRRIDLAGVRTVALNGREQLPLALRFARTGGRTMPVGVVRLTSFQGQSRWIVLPGHFSEIAKVSNEPQLSNIALSPPLYPKRIKEAICAAP